MIPRLFYCEQDKNYYTLFGVSCSSCGLKPKNMISLIEKWNRNRPCIIELYCNFCSSKISDGGADVLTIRLVIIVDEVSDIPRGHVLVPFMPPELGQGRYSSVFEGARVVEEGVKTVDNTKLSFRQSELIIGFEEEQRKLLAGRLDELDNPERGVEVLLERSYSGCPETVYPHCFGCGKLCHGCKVCGFVFCCSACEPCHEDLLCEGWTE